MFVNKSMNQKRQYLALEGLSEKEQLKREKRGRRFRVAADVATYGRTILGAGISMAILSGTSVLPKRMQYRSIGLATSIAGLVAADKIDGIFARRAATNGIPILEHDKRKDPFQDKVFAHVLMGSIAIREFSEGNTFFASVIAGCQASKLARDYKMSQSRKDAHPDADVSAIPINKYKTGLEGLSHMIATSPMADSEIGRSIAGSSYVLSNVVGLIGYKMADAQYKLPTAEN